MMPAINTTSVITLFDRVGTIQRLEKGLEGSDASANMRKDMFTEGIRLWSLKPVFGHGYGEFASISSFSAYSHNNYTELLCNTGLLGLLMYYGFHIAILLKIGKPRTSEKLLAIFMVLLILALDTGLVSQLLKSSWLFLVITAYLASLRSED
jgi:O-antigen ligase